MRMATYERLPKIIIVIMLEIQNIEVVYNKIILVLKGVSLKVPEKKIVALLGANGAGKTTTLKAISNLLFSELGEVTSGSIKFNNVDISHMRPDRIVRRGVVQVMEGRRLFEHFSVEENLIVGAYVRSKSSKIKGDLEKIYSYFPNLKEKRQKISGFLSGGERQMLVMGRALMARPKLMLLDEPFLGLSPLMVREICDIIQKINGKEGVSILLIEQNVAISLQLADYGYVMENGQIVLGGSSETLQKNQNIQELYLGLTQDQGPRDGEVKRYRHRVRLYE